MIIKFDFLGLKCLANGSMENGHFVADDITVAGDLDSALLPNPLFTELCNKMDEAANDEQASYVDNANYFGEAI